MSLDDDTCKSLIDAVKLVLTDCGVEHHEPSTESYTSVEDYVTHADEVWDDIRQNARSKSLSHRRTLLFAPTRQHVFQNRVVF